ncbi:MAG: hypothetical protein LBP42_02045 [Treponema sp.]|jgi:hypothetical protein|nr:hypothetical protein [Treponema sp.]
MRNLITPLLTALAVFCASSCTTAARQDVGVLLRDIPRHNSFRYLSAGTLPEAYFEAAGETLEDPYIYLILADTKTPAARIIAFFTGDRYNHVSLSFDKSLKTMVSYNGGNGRSSPGLNQETRQDLCGRPGAEIAVFKLFAGAGKKARILDRVRQINDEGSSYNRLGLIIKTSLKPNIMFCSQFVYTMLETAGLDYLDKKSGRVKPADFIDEGEPSPLIWVSWFSFAKAEELRPAPMVP